MMTPLDIRTTYACAMANPQPDHYAIALIALYDLIHEYMEAGKEAVSQPGDSKPITQRAIDVVTAITEVIYGPNAVSAKDWAGKELRVEMTNATRPSKPKTKN